MKPHCKRADPALEAELEGPALEAELEGPAIDEHDEAAVRSLLDAIGQLAGRNLPSWRLTFMATRPAPDDPEQRQLVLMTNCPPAELVAALSAAAAGALTEATPAGRG